MYFQIQDIKDNCLIIAYDNEKYYNYPPKEQKDLLRHVMLKVAMVSGIHKNLNIKEIEIMINSLINHWFLYFSPVHDRLFPLPEDMIRSICLPLDGCCSGCISELQCVLEVQSSENLLKNSLCRCLQPFFYQYFRTLDKT